MGLLCQVFFPTHTNLLPSLSRSIHCPHALLFSSWKGIDGTSNFRFCCLGRERGNVEGVRSRRARCALSRSFELGPAGEQGQAGASQHNPDLSPG